jgi:predicted XRE-type DNA-binding protein
MRKKTKKKNPPGVHKPEEHQLKAAMVAHLIRILEERDMSQADASRLLDIKQPDLSKILRHDAKGYSVALLMRMLAGFSYDVEITARPHRKVGKVGRIFFKRR